MERTRGSRRLDAALSSYLEGTVGFPGGDELYHGLGESICVIYAELTCARALADAGLPEESARHVKSALDAHRGATRTHEMLGRRLGILGRSLEDEGSLVD